MAKVLWVARSAHSDHPIPQLAEHLRSRGHTVTILPWGEATADRGKPYFRRVVVRRAGARREPISVHLFAPQFVAAIRRADADVVIHRDLGPVAVCVFVARLLGGPRHRIALLENDMADAGPAAAVWWKRPFRRLIGRLPTLFIANHQRASDYLKNVGVPVDRIITGWWMAGLAGSAAVGSTKPPVDAGGLRLAVVGKLIPRKGVDLLVRAVAHATSIGGVLRVDIAGDGEQRPRLEELATELGLSEFITFHGHVEHDELAVLVARADVVAMPSVEDHSGRAAIEALSLGVPVLVGDQTGAARLVVDHGRNGLHVDPHDTVSFGELLAGLDAQTLLALRTEAERGRGQFEVASCAAPLLAAMERLGHGVA